MNKKTNIKGLILFILVFAACIFMLFFGDLLPSVNLPG